MLKDLSDKERDEYIVRLEFIEEIKRILGLKEETNEVK